MATRGKSAREMQADIDAALRKRREQLGRGRWRRVAAITAIGIVGLAVTAIAVWLGLLALGLEVGHLERRRRADSRPVAASPLVPAVGCCVSLVRPCLRIRLCLWASVN